MNMERNGMSELSRFDPIAISFYRLEIYSLAATMELYSRTA